jgi:hypothetical protein
MTIRSFIEPGAFDPEALMVLGEAFEVAVKELAHDDFAAVAADLRPA